MRVEDTVKLPYDKEKELPVFFFLPPRGESVPLFESSAEPGDTMLFQAPVRGFAGFPENRLNKLNKFLVQVLDLCLFLRPSDG